MRQSYGKSCREPSTKQDLLGTVQEMGRLPHDWERETDAESVSRERAPAPPKQAAPVSTLAWASAVGNQAVQRLARQTVAREAVEEEEVDESAVEPEAVEDAAPAAEEAPPGDFAPEEAPADGAPAADEAPPGDFAPEEAEGLAALDDLPEDELPE